jgi:hypothetical protein
MLTSVLRPGTVTGTSIRCSFRNCLDEFDFAGNVDLIENGTNHIDQFPPGEPFEIRWQLQVRCSRLVTIKIGCYSEVPRMHQKITLAANTSTRTAKEVHPGTGGVRCLRALSRRYRCPSQLKAHLQHVGTRQQECRDRDAQRSLPNLLPTWRTLHPLTTQYGKIKEA